MIRIVAILFAFLLNSGVYASTQPIVGKARIIDGDTIQIAQQRIRLHGIDAPEGEQSCTVLGRTYPCGKQALDALANLISSHPVTCAPKDRDLYNRVVAVCHAGGHNLSGWMAGQGWALAYRRFSRDYVAHEKSAAKGKRGMWQGEFVAPWDWRRGQRLTPIRDTQPSKCRIKGNISSSGTRIYHVPGGQYYNRTKVNQSKGERWFCSEEKARAAGWRKSKRWQR
jgi:endonuclease YncB( thermonuclease family)